MTRRRLTETELQRYRRDGVVFPVAALSPQEVRHFSSQFLATRDALGPGATTVDIRHPQLFFRWAYELASCPTILDAVASIVGDDIILTRGAVFFKEPRSSVRHPLHQDAYCLGLTREHADRFVTAWVALTPSTIANGCMRVFPGTQYRQYTYNKSTPTWGVRNAFITDSLDGAREVAVELPAGAMSLHHATVVHHSHSNDTDEVRIGVVMRYASPDVRQQVPVKQRALLMRGRDSHGLYELADPPTVDIEKGVARMRAFAEYARRRAMSPETSAGGPRSGDG